MSFDRLKCRLPAAYLICLQLVTLSSTKATIMSFAKNLIDFLEDLRFTLRVRFLHRRSACETLVAASNLARRQFAQVSLDYH